MNREQAARPTLGRRLGHDLRIDAALDGWRRFGMVPWHLENWHTMNKLVDVLQLRVRYSETDQMGTFYHLRALEWFECGQTELMRAGLEMVWTSIRFSPPSS